ncbi:uncharacterized protein [Nicotiana sylvestris]|uniref:uncharacterized protein n=1 Tax=Nicotiana sylvestris TaxID=4096 RepID=UPI00388C5B3F
MADIYNQDPDFQLFCKGLKQREDQLARKVEELRERDEDLMKAIACNSELEVSLKVKEDELELSRGVMAENTNLQEKVASLTTQLGKKATEIDGLMGELSVSADKLATAISEAAVLENTLCTYRWELTKEKEASTLKVAELEGHVKELEAEISALTGQVASLRTEDARRHSQPSADGRASEVELQDMRAKAQAAHKACGYDPLTPDGDDINFDDANRLNSDSWYEDVYGTMDDV